MPRATATLHRRFTYQNDDGSIPHVLCYKAPRAWPTSVRLPHRPVMATVAAIRNRMFPMRRDHRLLDPDVCRNDFRYRRSADTWMLVLIRLRDDFESLIPRCPFRNALLRCTEAWVSRSSRRTYSAATVGLMIRPGPSHYSSSIGVFHPPVSPNTFRILL
jgi:hypothetical protein